MACCFCCVSEDQQIGRVLDKFPGVLPSQAVPGTVAKIVGRCAMASTSGALIAPLTSKPCVFYEVEVHEERERERKNAEGDISHEKYWHRVINEEKGVDFFLTDDAGAAVYVNCSTAKAKTYIVDDHMETAGDVGRLNNRGVETQVSPALHALMARHGQNSQERGWFGPNAKELKGKESSFAIGEAVAALGIVQGAAPNITLLPLTTDALTEEFMDDSSWTDFDKKSWAVLTKKYAAIILSDDPTLVGGLIASHAAPLPIIQQPQVSNSGGYQPVPQQQQQAYPGGPMMQPYGQQPGYPPMQQQQQQQQQAPYSQYPPVQQAPYGQQPGYYPPMQQPYPGQQQPYYPGQPMQPPSSGSQQPYPAGQPPPPGAYAQQPYPGGHLAQNLMPPFQPPNAAAARRDLPREAPAEGEEPPAEGEEPPAEEQAPAEEEPPAEK